MNKPLVQISVLNQGKLATGLVNSLAIMTHDDRCKVRIDYPAGRPIQHNRNEIAKRFLMSRADFLLMIDSDIVPKKSPLDLVQMNKDVLGLPCPQWREGDIFWVVMDRVRGGFRPVRPERRFGLAEVDAVGTGCILIARRVLERLKAPFNIEWTEDGTLEMGLDFAFCLRVRQAGFSVWTHWAYVCSHFKTLDLVEVIGLAMRKSGGK